MATQAPTDRPLYNYTVRNYADAHETQAWPCQAYDEVDAAHQYLAAFWSAGVRDDGTWYSPTYTGDIDGANLVILLDITK